MITLTLSNFEYVVQGKRAITGWQLKCASMKPMKSRKKLKKVKDGIGEHVLKASV